MILKDIDDDSQTTIQPKNKGTLKIDATVANQKIVFPTDSGLLNRSRKESESIIDLLYEQSNLVNKHRDYRRIARTEYLIFSKKRRKSKKFNRRKIRTSKECVWIKQYKSQKKRHFRKLDWCYIFYNEPNNLIKNSRKILYSWKFKNK